MSNLGLLLIIFLFSLDTIINIDILNLLNK